MLILYLILRRFSLKLKIFPHLPRDQKKRAGWRLLTRSLEKGSLFNLSGRLRAAPKIKATAKLPQLQAGGWTIPPDYKIEMFCPSIRTLGSCPRDRTEVCMTSFCVVPRVLRE
jgi:hypothetical protein